MKGFDKQQLFSSAAACAMWLLVLTGWPCSTPAGTVTDDLRTKIDALISILEDRSFAEPEHADKKLARLHDIADTAFDWADISQRTLCDYWPQISPGQQQLFINKFSNFLCSVYLAKIESFVHGVEGFSAESILFTDEIIEGEYALVKTVIQSDKGFKTIDYKLRNKNHQWSIYDVVINNIGFVADYKSQCGRILAHDGFNALIDRIDSKAEM